MLQFDAFFADLKGAIGSVEVEILLPGTVVLQNGLHRLHRFLVDGPLLVDHDLDTIGEHLEVDIVLGNSRAFDTNETYFLRVYPLVKDICGGAEADIVGGDLAQMGVDRYSCSDELRKHTPCARPCARLRTSCAHTSFCIISCVTF